jgi:hypothetical protein
MACGPAMDQPLLPGSEEPADSRLPLAYIYQPAPSAMQSAPVQKVRWLLEFEPSARPEIDPLMGWTSSYDPFASTWRLRFPDLQSAVNFAERHGWRCLVRKPLLRCIRPKSYADNFR